MNKIKLVAVDMDGTACELHGETIKENIKPILQAQKAGIKVIFATGRPLYKVSNEALKYNMDKHSKYIIAYNGACIWDLENDKEARSVVINADIVDKIFKIANKYNIKVWCSTSDIYKIVANFQTKTFEERSFNLEKKVVIEERKKTDSFKVEAYKLLIINDDANNKGHKFIYEIAKKYNFNIAQGLNPVYELVGPNTNKGIALKWIADKLNISKENVMAIGDGDNDISMFKYARLSIAMENATDDVKKYADEVTDINTNAGVAKAFYKYVLNK